MKNELYLLCLAHKRSDKYALDEYVKNNTIHEILRLPPYHAIYNPIELVWGLAKRYDDKHIGRNGIWTKDMAALIWNEALDFVTPTIWNNICEKIETRIKNDYERVYNNDISPDLVDCSDDEESSENDSDSDENNDYNNGRDAHDSSKSPNHFSGNDKMSARKNLFHEFEKVCVSIEILLSCSLNK